MREHAASGREAAAAARRLKGARTRLPRVRDIKKTHAFRIFTRGKAFPGIPRWGKPRCCKVSKKIWRWDRQRVGKLKGFGGFFVFFFPLVERRRTDFDERSERRQRIRDGAFFFLLSVFGSFDYTCGRKRRNSFDRESYGTLENFSRSRYKKSGFYLNFDTIHKRDSVRLKNMEKCFDCFAVKLRRVLRELVVEPYAFP